MRDKNYLRSTKIVATVGTATDNIQKIKDPAFMKKLKAMTLKLEPLRLLKIPLSL